MNNISCDVMRDLLPLYHDGVCNADSAALVRAHMETCRACREELARMDADVTAPQVGEDRTLRAVGKAWTRAKRRAFRRGLGIAGGIFLAIALLIGVFFFFFAPVRMISSSMEPTLSHGDWCLIRRGATPRRGDIIAVPLEQLGFDGLIDIVRVAAVPGDTVEIRAGDLLVNGRFDSRFSEGTLEPEGDWSYPLVLGMDEYFVLGDNTSNSMDSRYSEYGLVIAEDILGVYAAKLPG